MSPETCRAELKRLINEKVAASCWLFTSLYTTLIYIYVAGAIMKAAQGEEKYHRTALLKMQLNFLKTS